MLVNIQAPDVANLLWDIFKELPHDLQEQYAERVNRAATLVEHPTLDGAVLLTLGGDSALKPPGTF
jgi:hypothetical protein